MNLNSRQKLSKLLLDMRGDKSRRGFAREIGVTATAIIGWEKTDSVPDREHLAKIASLAGYSLDELLRYLDGTVQKKSSKIPLSRLITEAAQLNTNEITALYRAVSDRLVAIAESAGR